MDAQEDFLLSLHCKGESTLYPPKGKPYGCAPQQVIPHFQRQIQTKRQRQVQTKRQRENFNVVIVNSPQKQSTAPPGSPQS